MIADVLLAFVDNIDNPYELARLVALRSQNTWGSVAPNGETTERGLQVNALQRLIPYDVEAE